MSSKRLMILTEHPLAGQGIHVIRINKENSLGVRLLQSNTLYHDWLIGDEINEPDISPVAINPRYIKMIVELEDE